MKIAKIFSFLMFCILSCTTYADENKYIFVGQNGDGESAKTAFFLEVSAEDLHNTFVMSENGEIYLKADKIVSIPKMMFADFARMANFGNRDLKESSVSGRREAEQRKCPVCEMYYTPQPGKGCTNPRCPSNQ